MFPSLCIGGISFATFPILIFIAIVACTISYMTSPIYKKFYQVIVFKTYFPIMIFAAIGARVFSAITLMFVSEKPFSFNLLFGGAVFYGGIIGGIIGLLIICVIKHYEFLVFTDLFATLLPLGQAIGRIGCYLNGCCYGCQYSGPFAIDYIIEGVHTTVIPTWFLEAGFCLALFLYFQCIHKNNISGKRTTIYLVSYSSFRFCIEFLRGDEMKRSLPGK